MPNTQTDLNTFMGHPVERLSEVFDLVKPRPNWKDPIDATVSRRQATKQEVVAAVGFFAGGFPDIDNETGTDFHVSGAGYYEWVGA